MSASHTRAATSNSKRLVIALVMTSTYMVAEVVGGIMTGSLALLSDAAHMLTDVIGFAIALVAIRLGQRPADAKRTYGYYRFEILAAVVNAVMVILIAFYILYEAYQRFQSPPDIESLGMFIVATVGLVVNIVSMRILRPASQGSLNVKAAYLDALADMLGSIGVIAAAVVIYFTGWWQADPILAVLVGFWILPRSWSLISESVNILLEGAPREVNLRALYDALAALPNVSEVHDLHVWAITSGKNSLSAHLSLNAAGISEEVLKQAQGIAELHQIQHSNFQVEIGPHPVQTH